MRAVSIDIKMLDRICVLTIVAAALVGGFLAYRHVSQTRAQFSLENEILSKRMIEVNLATTNLKDLRSALEELNTRMGLMNERIPAAGKIGTFIDQVDALVTRQNVTMVMMKPLAAVEMQSYLKIPIQLVFRGDFIDVFQVVDLLEHMNRIVITEKIVVDKGSTDQSQCKADLKISVFERAPVL